MAGGRVQAGSYVLNDILSRSSLALPGKYKSSVSVCHMALCGRILLYTPCSDVHCVDTIYCTRQLLRQLLAFLLFQLTSFARAPSLRLSLCCSYGFCLSCEQLSSCKFIDSTCGCSLATFVFVRSLISMCKLIKASKSKLKHFAPAADGNSIQLHRLELNRIEEKRRESVCAATSRIRVGTLHLL